MRVWSRTEMQKDIKMLDRNIAKIKYPHFKKMVIYIIDKFYYSVALTKKEKGVLIEALKEIKSDIKYKVV